MPQVKNHLELIKYLPKTNCRVCHLPTCLAFAVAVIKGDKHLKDCPYIDPEVLGSLEVAGQAQAPAVEDGRRALEGLQKKVSELDLPARADIIGARWENGRLAIPCLSKDFYVDAGGVLNSGCHVNEWVYGPILNYVLSCKGVEPSGRWVPLRDLPGGQDWYRLFGQRCEKPLQKVVDNYTDLFKDIVDIFDGERAQGFDSDIAVIVHPLPLLPMMICYWEPEGPMESQLNLFFDDTATHNLIIDSIYTLGVGLLTMFEKISQTHGK